MLLRSTEQEEFTEPKYQDSSLNSQSGSETPCAKPEDIHDIHTQTLHINVGQQSPLTLQSGIQSTPTGSTPQGVGGDVEFGSGGDRNDLSTLHSDPLIVGQTLVCQTVGQAVQSADPIHTSPPTSLPTSLPSTSSSQIVDSTSEEASFNPTDEATLATTITNTSTHGDQISDFAPEVNTSGVNTAGVTASGLSGSDSEVSGVTPGVHGESIELDIEPKSAIEEGPGLPTCDTPSDTVTHTVTHTDFEIQDSETHTVTDTTSITDTVTDSIRDTVRESITETVDTSDTLTTSDTSVTAVTTIQRESITESQETEETEKVTLSQEESKGSTVSLIQETQETKEDKEDIETDSYADTVSQQKDTVSQTELTTISQEARIPTVSPTLSQDTSAVTVSPDREVTDENRKTFTSQQTISISDTQTAIDNRQTTITTAIETELKEVQQDKQEEQLQKDDVDTAVSSLTIEIGGSDELHESQLQSERSELVITKQDIKEIAIGDTKSEDSESESEMYFI